jgi:hydroxymethylpyrimidine/phosphomethylpyrimidine kinase
MKLKKNSVPWTLDSGHEKPVLLISASDSSAAAGLQVDLRVVNDLGASARCAVTAVTIQGDRGARSINPVPSEVITGSITMALSDSPGIGAVKVGLLGDVPTVEALEGPLSEISAARIPIVVDPVMRSTPGSVLAAEDTVDALLEKVLPWTTLITPNRDELKALGRPGGDGGAEEGSAIDLLTASGGSAVLVTGGDTTEDQCLDTLYETGGSREEFYHPRIGEAAPRGTGCALSTAIAVHLGRGIPLRESVRRSIDYVTGLITRAARVGDQLLLFPGKRP